MVSDSAGGRTDGRLPFSTSWMPLESSGGTVWICSLKAGVWGWLCCSTAPRAALHTLATSVTAGQGLARAATRPLPKVKFSCQKRIWWLVWESCLSHSWKMDWDLKSVHAWCSFCGIASFSWTQLQTPTIPLSCSHPSSHTPAALAASFGRGLPWAH